MVAMLGFSISTLRQEIHLKATYKAMFHHAPGDATRLVTTFGINLDAEIGQWSAYGVTLLHKMRVFSHTAAVVGATGCTHKCLFAGASENEESPHVTVSGALPVGPLLLLASPVVIAASRGHVQWPVLGPWDS